MALNYTPHYLLRLGGQMGPERWSIGLRLDSNQDQLLVAQFSEAMTEVVESHARTLFNVLRQYMVPAVTWDYISCNQIGRDGKYTQAQSYERYVTPIPGTSNTTSWCGPDAAVVVTLLTDKQRGYASKGRVYLPLQASLTLVTTGSDFGDINASIRGTIGTAFAAFCTELNDLGTDLTTNNPALVGSSVFVGVYSPGTGKKQDMTKPGEYQLVRAVRVGAQLDTQRRRLNKQPDLWDTTTTSYPVAG